MKEIDLTPRLVTKVLAARLVGRSEGRICQLVRAGRIKEYTLHGYNKARVVDLVQVMEVFGITDKGSE